MNADVSVGEKHRYQGCAFATAPFNSNQPHAQLSNDIVDVINASEIDDPSLVARTLCWILISLIQATDKQNRTFLKAGKTAIWILKTVIKNARYEVGKNNEVIDVKTNQEVSPGGLKH